MRTFFARTWARIKSHKLIAAVCAVVILGGGYYAYGYFTAAPTQTSYVLAAAQTGSLIVSVSGNGQVAASNSVDVLPKASAAVTAVNVQPGDSVKAGQVLVRLDPTNAQQALQSAESDLMSAQLSLQKLQEPATTLSVTEAQDAIAQAQQDQQTAQNSLASDYTAGFNTVASTFLNLPSVMNGLNTVINNTGVSPTQDNLDAYYDLIKNNAPQAEQFRATVLSDYTAAQAAYQQNLTDFQSTKISSSPTVIAPLITETYKTAQTIAQAVKDTKNFLDLVTDTYQSDLQGEKLPALLTTHESDVESYTTTITTNLNDLLNATNSITSDQNQITADGESITEKQQSFASLQSGPDPIDLQTQQLSIQEKQEAVQQAQLTLAETAVTAPLAGTVSAVDVQVGSNASAGSAVATIITTQQIATLSLNEVDVSKIALGQPATLTFDAVPDLTIAGTVDEIDPVGTVSQGVVSYNVQIGFNTQDSRIKPGMSATAEIDTNSDQNVLLVPNAAVKTQSGTSYVEVEDGSSTTSTATPMIVPVTVGLSNDSETEITSGLSAGKMVVVQTLGGTTAAASAGGTSGLSLLGGRAAGGGAGGAAFLGGGGAAAGGARAAGGAARGG